MFDFFKKKPEKKIMAGTPKMINVDVSKIPGAEQFLNGLMDQMMPTEIRDRLEKKMELIFQKNGSVMNLTNVKIFRAGMRMMYDAMENSDPNMSTMLMLFIDKLHDKKKKEVDDKLEKTATVPQNVEQANPTKTA